MDKAGQPEGVLTLMKLRKSKISASEAVPADPEKVLFETLFVEHWGPIYRHVLRLVGDPAEAEDLALETFFRLHQRHSKPGEEFNAGGWLYRVATNLGLQSIRSFNRRVHYELTAGKDALANGPENRPAEILAQKEEQNLARVVLARMNQRQSQLLVLRHSGLSYAEIARALKLSPTSIGPLLLRAELQFEKLFHALNAEEL